MTIRYQSDLFMHLEDVDTTSQDLPLAGSDADPRAALREMISVVRAAPNDATTLDSAAAWLGQHGYLRYQVDCLARLEQLGMLDADGHSNYGSALLKLGDEVSAAAQFRISIDKDPDDPRRKLSLAVALLQSARSGEAARLLLRRSNRLVEDEAYIYQLAATLAQEHRPGMALRLAHALCVARPQVGSYALFLANLLAGQRDYEAARAIIAARDDVGSAGHHLLSSMSLAQGRTDDALDEIDQALQIDPDNTAYRAHRASVLAAQHRFDEAAADIARALIDMPQDTQLRHTAFVIYTEAGRYDEALKIGAALVAQSPNDEPLNGTLRIVIERRERLQAIARGEEARATQAGRFGDAPVVSHPAAWRKPKHPLITQGRVIAALILRETRTRFGRSRFGYAWVLFEPLAHIGIMITLISLLSHSKIPPVGESFALFYFTGIIPYHLFTHTVSHIMKSVPENRPLLQLPPVKAFDVYLARAILELVTELVVAGLLLCAFVFFGLSILPINAAGVALAILLLWSTAAGLGMIFAVMCAYFSGWERLWGAVASMLYFSSGTFYIPRMMPESIRDILAWNPILQGIELVRTNYFLQPHPYWLDVPYLTACAVGALAVGMTMERLFRRKVMEVE